MTPRAPFTIQKKISVPDNSLNRTLKLSCGDTIAVEYDCCQCGKLSLCDIIRYQQVGLHSSENNHQINASWRFLMRFVQCSCARLRRVCAPTRTGSNRQYSHFRRNLSAPVDLLLRWGSACCAVYTGARKTSAQPSSNWRNCRESSALLVCNAGNLFTPDI